MNSRAKGKRGELELVHVLNGYGFVTRRGQQFSGVNGDADIVGIDGLHIECKRRERLDIEASLQQSERDARPCEVACVIHRKNNEDWKVTLRLGEFVKLWQGVKK